MNKDVVILYVLVKLLIIWRILFLLNVIKIYVDFDWICFFMLCDFGWV